MIGADAALVLIAGAFMLGVCVGVWLGWRLHITQVQIDAEHARTGPRRRG